MTDFYSRNDVNYNGDVYSIPFPYIKEEEIQVFLDDTLFEDWFFLNDSQIKLRTIPQEVTSNTIVSVRRNTDIDKKVVTYTNNTLLNKENLNLSQDQLLYAVQEIYDNNVQFQIDTDDVIETNKQELLEIQDDFKQEVYKIVDTVKDAADKVNELEEAVNTAVTAANTATEQAEIAINKTDETIELVEQFTENIDSKILTNNENMQSVLAETEAVLQEAKDTLDDTLNKSQITNCITEIPQRIKYTLVDGTLTIKAGSVVIVPYGTEDKTSEFPVGSRFLHDNFKVCDTQFADGKFFVWAEFINDHSQSYNSTSTLEHFVFIRITGSNYYTVSTVNCYSGATDSISTTSSHSFYNTDENLCKIYNASGQVNSVFSLPILILQGNGTQLYSKILQVFNGFGKNGSTCWSDKGIKFLCPNGRNADGTLNNIERVTKKIDLDNLLSADRTYVLSETALSRRVSNCVFIQDDMPSLPIADSHANWFNPSENIMYYADPGETTWTKTNAIAIVGSASLSHFDFKQPFRAVDYNDFANTPHITQTYVNGTSGYRIWSDKYCEQWGTLSQTSSGTTTQTIEFVKAFIDTNYGFYTSADAKSFTLTTTSCKASYAWGNGGSAYGTIFWIAKGYIA